MNKKNLVLTEAIRTQLERTQYLEHSVPLYLTSSFVFEDAEDMRASFAEEKDRNIYSRYSNPNTNEFVEKYVKWKGNYWFTFASGMAIYQRCSVGKILVTTLCLQ
jgi:O-succinylhomoserine sulfhydrylase